MSNFLQTVEYIGLALLMAGYFAMPFQQLFPNIAYFIYFAFGVGFWLTFFAISKLNDRETRRENAKPGMKTAGALHLYMGMLLFLSSLAIYALFPEPGQILALIVFGVGFLLILAWTIESFLSTKP
jgi:hypothetical protein